MNIVFNNKRTKRFGEVISGSVINVPFNPADGGDCVAMKVDYFEGNYGDPVNCVDMADGAWFYVEDSFEVEVLNAKLVID